MTTRPSKRDDVLEEAEEALAVLREALAVLRATTAAMLEVEDGLFVYGRPEAIMALQRRGETTAKDHRILESERDALRQQRDELTKHLREAWRIVEEDSEHGWQDVGRSMCKGWRTDVLADPAARSVLL